MCDSFSFQGLNYHIASYFPGATTCSIKRCRCIWHGKLATGKQPQMVLILILTVEQFAGLSSFKGRGLERWDVSNVEDFDYMFLDTWSLFNLDLSQWNVSSATKMDGMFINSGFTGDLSTWDTSKVEDFDRMFVDTKFNGGNCVI